MILQQLLLHHDLQSRHICLKIGHVLQNTLRLLILDRSCPLVWQDRLRRHLLIVGSMMMYMWYPDSGTTIHITHSGVDNDVTIQFDKQRVIVLEQETKKKVLAEGKEVGGLYQLPLVVSRGEACNTVKVSGER